MLRILRNLTTLVCRTKMISSVHQQSVEIAALKELLIWQFISQEQFERRVQELEQTQIAASPILSVQNTCAPSVSFAEEITVEEKINESNEAPKVSLMSSTSANQKKQNNQITTCEDAKSVQKKHQRQKTLNNNRRSNTKGQKQMNQKVRKDVRSKGQQNKRQQSKQQQNKTQQSKQQQNKKQQSKQLQNKRQTQKQQSKTKHVTTFNTKRADGSKPKFNRRRRRRWHEPLLARPLDEHLQPFEQVKERGFDHYENKMKHKRRQRQKRALDDQLDIDDQLNTECDEIDEIDESKDSVHQNVCPNNEEESGSNDEETFEFNEFEFGWFPIKDDNGEPIKRKILERPKSGRDGRRVARTHQRHPSKRQCDPMFRVLEGRTVTYARYRRLPPTVSLVKFSFYWCRKLRDGGESSRLLYRQRGWEMERERRARAAASTSAV